MIVLNLKGFEFGLFTIFTSTSKQTRKQTKQRENETKLSNMICSRGNPLRFKVQMACKRIKL